MSKRTTITRMQNILAAVKAVPEISSTMKADLSQLFGELVDRRRQATLNKDAFTSRYAAEEEWREHSRYLDGTFGFKHNDKTYASIVDWLYSERETNPYEGARDEELFQGAMSDLIRERNNLANMHSDACVAYNTLVEAIQGAKESSKECNVCSPNGNKPLYDLLNEILDTAKHLYVKRLAEKSALQSDSQEEEQKKEGEQQ